MKVVKLLIALTLILYLSACEKELTYENNYNLENVEVFIIHQDDMYPLFILDGEIYLLDSSADRVTDAIHNTRIGVLFENHASNNDFEGLEYRNITSELFLSETEEVIEVIDYFEGWLFLTNLGNVIKYELLPDPEMEKEFFVYGRDNLITLQDDEQIVDMYYRDEFQVRLLRFETSRGRFFDFEEGSLNSIFGYQLYDDSIFSDGEVEKYVLLDHSNDAYFIVTNLERVLRYDTTTSMVSDQSHNFPMDEGEVIVAFNYESQYRRIYVTNYGRAVSINLEDYSVYGEFNIDINLDDNEQIVDYQRGYYGCGEGMALITTNQNRVFILPNIDSTAVLFDESNLILDNDSIKSIEISNFGTHSCGTSSRLIYNGKEISDFQYIIIIETNDNHTYLLGFFSKYINKDFDANYVSIKIR